MSGDAAPCAETLLIVGAGLIGSSIAHDVRRAGLARRIFVLDADEGVIERVRALGFADEAASSADAFSAKADMAVLATPVRAMAAAAKACAPALAEGAAVFDTGSVKGAVMQAIASDIAAVGAHFVPAHPIAGTEQSGPDAGFPGLFAGKWCVLTPEPDADEAALARVEALWSGCGALTARMSAEDHDALLALTSHVPHLVAYALTATATDEAGAPRGDVVRYSAGGFRDFTRIAASDPVMWRDVFLTNKQAVLSALGRFEREIAHLRAAVEAGDGAALEDRFAATRKVRAAIVEAGQETAEPDFGRAHDHEHSED